MSKIPLRVYVERHWADHRREHDRGQDSLDARLHVLNELRGGVLTREEYNARHESLDTAINVLRERVTKMEGRGAGLNAGWGYIIGAIGAAGTVIAVILLLHG